jgi:hypothetical protein
MHDLPGLSCFLIQPAIETLPLFLPGHNQLAAEYFGEDSPWYL